MILRRITKHVKDQNWFAVGLDFFIVVLGILIAFQITEWNERRTEAAMERVLLEGLREDFLAISRGDNERFKRTVEAPGSLAVLIESIRRDEEPAPEVVWSGLEAALIAYAPTQASPTYDELKASGRLSQLKSRELRQRLADFERSLFNEEKWGEHLVVSSFGAQLYAHIDTDTTENGFDLSGSYEWKGVAQTLPYLQQRLIFIQAQAAWRRNSRQQAEDILELVEEALE